jgi:hypothetical protein
MHILEVCTEENGVLEEEFDLVMLNIENLQSRVQTDKRRIDFQVAGVGIHIQPQEIGTGISVLQSRDHQIIEEAESMFLGHQLKIDAISKRIMENTTQIPLIKGTIIRIQQSLKEMNKKIDNVNKVLESIYTSMRDVPSRRELREHALHINQQVAQIQDINTGSTLAMGGYKFFKVSQFDFTRQNHNDYKQVHLRWFTLRDSITLGVLHLV